MEGETREKKQREVRVFRGDPGWKFTCRARTGVGRENGEILGSYYLGMQIESRVGLEKTVMSQLYGKAFTCACEVCVCETYGHGRAVGYLACLHLS